MPTTAEPDWNDLAPAERARMRLDDAAVSEPPCRAVSGSPLDPSRWAAYQRREAAAELAEADAMARRSRAVD